METSGVYSRRYQNSWALVIGIDRYRYGSPLSCACNDAKAVADVLVHRFDFPEENVLTLLDEDATRDAIMSSYLGYAGPQVVPDDRIVVFFAGHGHTRTGRRGEVGYLVPFDGDTDSLSTLVRWDELTRNAELIPAKHILYIMDACYGGLAIMRTVLPGGMRFLGDMLTRYARQVLTAGKADEVVADAGGPRSNHSVFTGHLLDALEGAVASSNGIVTANGVIAYVYDRVAKDPQSSQSPHYGFLDGDGDLVFNPPDLDGGDHQDELDRDTLVEVPNGLTHPVDYAEEASLIDATKKYLADSKYLIRLNDLVGSEVRSALQAMGEHEFPLSAQSTIAEDFTGRLSRYEKAISSLVKVSILVARWGKEDHRPSLSQIISRLADNNVQRDGSIVALALRWYPLMYLMYSAGIAALSAGHYENLFALMLTNIGSPVTGQASEEVIIRTVKSVLQLERGDFFRVVPGHERYHTPRSEYLLKRVQPQLEDLLFLGRSYEELFDRFEVLYALVYADIYSRDRTSLWGPVGRFGWKYRHEPSGNPFDTLVCEAESRGSDWPPLQAGFFGGSYDRFVEVSKGYREQLLNGLPWR